MSPHAQENYPFPEETARVTHAIFPTGNLVMRLYDELGMLFHDRDFADLFPVEGQPAEAPTRLALVTLLQFMEGSPIVRRQRPFARASTGNISSAWN